MTTDHEIDGLDFPTSLGTATADQIGLLGKDLTADLMGKVGFGELAFWLVAMRRPTPGEVRVFEAVLVALADHGFTPTAIAARLTYLSAPDSLQGCSAAAPGSSASPRTAAAICMTSSNGRTANCLPTTPAGTRWRWRPSGKPGRSAGSCPASVIRCTNTATHEPRS